MRARISFKFAFTLYCAQAPGMRVAEIHGWYQAIGQLTELYDFLQRPHLVDLAHGLQAKLYAGVVRHQFFQHPLQQTPGPVTASPRVTPAHRTRGVDDDALPPSMVRGCRQRLADVIEGTLLHLGIIGSQVDKIGGVEA